MTGWRGSSRCDLPDKSFVMNDVYTEKEQTLINYDPNIVNVTLNWESPVNWVGKFFAHFARGFIKSIDFYLQNTGAPTTLEIGIAPFPGDLSRFQEYTFVVAVPTTAGAWCNIVVNQFFNFDPIFVYTREAVPANVTIAYDAQTPTDGYESTDSGENWSKMVRRYAIRINYSGKTEGDVPVCGTINVKEIEKPPEVLQKVTGRVNLSTRDLAKILHTFDPAGLISDIESYKNFLYFSVGANLYRYDFHTIQLIWTHPGAANINILKKGIRQEQSLFIGCSNGNVYFFRSLVFGPPGLLFTDPGANAIEQIWQYGWGLFYIVNNNELWYHDFFGVMTFLVFTSPGNIISGLVLSKNEYLYCISGGEYPGAFNNIYIHESQDWGMNWTQIYQSTTNNYAIIAARGTHSKYGMENGIIYNNELYFYSWQPIGVGISRLYKCDIHGDKRIVKEVSILSNMFSMFYNLIIYNGRLLIASYQAGVIYQYFDGNLSEYITPYPSAGWGCILYQVCRGLLFFTAIDNTYAFDTIYYISPSFTEVQETKMFNLNPVLIHVAGAAGARIPLVGAALYTNYDRKVLTIQPLNGNIWVGFDNTVAANLGFYLRQFEILTIDDYIGEVWVIRDGGANVNVSYSEGY